MYFPLMFTASGFVTAQHGNLFGNVPEFWQRKHTAACIAVVRKHMPMFAAQAAEQEKEQALAEVERQRVRKEYWNKKLMKDLLEAVSYFNVPTLRSVKNMKMVDGALASMRSQADKVAFLTQLINMYVKGFNMKQFQRPMSSATDKSVGKYDDLYARVKEILSKRLTIPTTLPIGPIKQFLSPDSYGLTATTLYDELVAKHQQNAVDSTQRIQQIDKDYGVKLMFSWDSIPRNYWDMQLTPLQSLFSRGATFEDDGVE